MTERLICIDPSGLVFLEPPPSFPAIDCICKELDSILDPDAFDYERSGAVVIHNNSGHMVSTCEYGHRAHTFSLYLCSPTYGPMQDAIDNNRVVVKRRYDTLGHPISD